MKRRNLWLDAHREEARGWLMSKGFVLSTDGVDLYREWADGLVTLVFEALRRHPSGDIGCAVSVGYQYIGTCETLADIQMVCDTIRRINGDREG